MRRSNNTSYEEPNSLADDQTNFANAGGKPRLPQFKSTSLYLLCYSMGLCVYWFFILWIFYQTLDNYTPKLQTDHAFIGSNPGLGYRPMRQKSDPYSSLIWFKHGKDGNWIDLKENLDEFLTEYEPGYWANAGSSQTKCPDGREPLQYNEACEFNIEWLSDPDADFKCITADNYGYRFGKPCLLLKLNRVFGWQPHPYFNIMDVDNHTTMPQDLKKHIRHEWQTALDDGECRIDDPRCSKLNMIWLHCDGEYPVDRENLGSVKYTPWRGFPARYFPYWNQLGYLQPVVMVQLQNPVPGVLINIQCTAWAHNIEHDISTMKGSVHIEFIMD